MKNTASFLSLFIVISLTGSLYAQKMTSSKIDALLERVLESTPSVGIAVAVVKDGKQIHSKGYGFKSINGKEKVAWNRARFFFTGAESHKTARRT